MSGLNANVWQLQLLHYIREYLSKSQLSFTLCPHEAVLRKWFLNFQSPYTYHYVGHRTSVRELDPFCLSVGSKMDRAYRLCFKGMVNDARSNFSEIGQRTNEC